MITTQRKFIKDAAIERGLAEIDDYQKGNRSDLRTYDVTPPAIDVRVIREKLALTQKGFSDRYGIPIRTLQDWEQKRRNPEGSVLMFLRLIDCHPQEIENLIKDSF